jgi:hypothetical protein
VIGDFSAASFEEIREFGTKRVGRSVEVRLGDAMLASPLKARRIIC